MKLILSLIILFLPGLNNQNPIQEQSFKISSFKEVPADLQGCGECYYLSEKNKKRGEIICTTDYDRALIYVNGKPILLTADSKLETKKYIVFTNGNYELDIQQGPIKQLDTEYYVMKATVTIKYVSKIIWSRNLIGEGGC